MPRIRDERTGSGELLRDGRYHYAALLADPETAHLAPAVKKQLDALTQAEATTTAAELARLECQALANRAEYLHDQKQRTVELIVLGATAKNRRAVAYQQVYPQGLSGLVALSGEEQEQAVTQMVAKLVTHHPDVAKKHGKELQALAAAATAAERAVKSALASEGAAFLDEQAARGELKRQLRRNEGALIMLFPEDRARVRLYYRGDAPKRPADPDPAPPASDPTPSPSGS
jgi:hypothetical protein